MLIRKFPQLINLASQSLKKTKLISLRNTLNPLKRGFVYAYNFSQAQNSKAQKMEFKAQTKRLLDIVAKSLYTDSQVFLRELLSNASDALQKQRFYSQNGNDLFINIDLSPTKHQIIIQDNGVGMSKQQLISNLGTIARSGSKQFVQKIAKETQSDPNKKGNTDIIGQFGVGFYSSFIVSDLVQVFSKKQNGPTYLWTSDGTGQFTIQQIQDNSFDRGTKIILHLKESQTKFIEKNKVQEIVTKYSNFINYPISINGETFNTQKAIWTRDKKQISDEEYLKFYHYITHKTDNYKYKMHFASDVPFMIKSILYIPKEHTEKFGMGQQQGQVSLYSKRILIKKNCKNILIPNFLRFMKGVVDCQDIPLNISRENYQDSALMHKLKVFLTKRILKFLKDQGQKRPDQYNRWYKDFQHFIKQGSLDYQFKKDVIELNRYELNTAQGFHSLKDYLKIKDKTIDRIFFFFSPNKNIAKDSPYMFPLTNAGIPVLIVTTPIDQAIFRQIDTFQGLKFSNIQTDHDDVQRALKAVQGQKKQQNKSHKIKEQEITTFSLWIKNQLQPFVDKVVVSKKSISGPAIVISPISTSMRQMAFMRQMMDQNVKAGSPRADLRNLTFQYNPNDQLISKLNQLRKIEVDQASMIIRQIFDNCCMQTGIQGDIKSMIRRISQMMNHMVDKQLQRGQIQDKKQ